DVDRDGEQLEGVAEGGRGLLSPDQVDREHTRGAAGEVALGQRRVGTPGDPRVVDPPDAGGLVQACGQGGGVLADALHAQVQGLDTDQHLLGAGSGQGGAEVGDVFGAG